MGWIKQCFPGASLLIFCLVAGCGHVDRTEPDTRFDENKSLFGATRDADRLVLYEGLPHQSFEPQQLEEEKQRKETTTLHGYPFYGELLDVSAEDVAQLKELLADEGSFRRWSGEKPCGGFHPDYLAELRVGEVTYRFLICFGCSELKVYGPGHSLR